MAGKARATDRRVTELVITVGKWPTRLRAPRESPHHPERASEEGGWGIHSTSCPPGWGHPHTPFLGCLAPGLSGSEGLAEAQGTQPGELWAAAVGGLQVQVGGNLDAGTAGGPGKVGGPENTCQASSNI